MNVLILAVSRSGSRTVSKAFSETFDLVHIGEPFNKGGQFDYLPKFSKEVRDKFLLTRELPDKWVLKTIVDQISMIDLMDLYNRADLTIILGRRDTDDRKQSFQHAVNKLGLNWHQNYLYSPVEIDPEVQGVVDRQELCISLFSKVLNIPITYYEDLFFDEEFRNNFTRRFDDKQDKFLSLIDPKGKYRKIKNKII